MNVEIAGKNYKIITTDSKNIHFEVEHDIPIIFAPADIDINTLEQFIKNNKIHTAHTEEVIYYDRPIKLFQQDYLLKIIKNSTANKVLVKSRTISLYYKGSTDYQKQLSLWQKQFVLQQLSDLISSWEEKLGVLVGTIKLRAFKKNIYSLQSQKGITFSKSVCCLSHPELQYLTFKAIAEHFAFTKRVRKAHFPEEKLMEDQIAYTLKTCQQSN